MRPALPILLLSLTTAAPLQLSAGESTAPANEAAAPKPTKEQVEKWIKELGSEEATVRDEAEQKLRDAGSAIDDWMVAPTKGLSGDAQLRVLEIFDHHLRVAHFDKTVGKLDEKDWVFVQLRLDTLLVLLLEDRHLWPRLQSAASKKDAPPVVVALVQWGDRENHYEDLLKRDAEAEALGDKIEAARDPEEKAKLEVELEKFKDETAKKFFDPLFAACKAALDKQNSNPGTTENPEKETPKDPPAEP